MAKDTFDPLLDDPPKPRAAGSDSHTNDEDKIVAQIEAEQKDAFDAEVETQAEPAAPMRVLGKDKKRRFFTKPKFWFGLLGLLLLAATIGWLLTPSRLWLLNTLGFKAEVVVTTAVAAVEGSPAMLANTTVVINGQSLQTSETGQARTRVSYGPLRIEATKAGYESVTKDAVLDVDPFFGLLGTNQNDIAIRNPVLLMKTVGVTVGFVAKDWLSGMPVTTGTFKVGDVTAQPSGDGKVLLSLPPTDAKTVVVTASFDNSYTNKQAEVAVGDTAQEITFVPAGTHYFISKRSGQYAVYGSKLDGSELAEVVAPAAAETGDVAFSANPASTHGVLASTREATRDTFGSVQQKLYVVDLTSKKLNAVDTALRFDLVDWSGDTLVYKATVRASGGGLAERLASITVRPQVSQKNIAGEATYDVVRVSLNSVVYLRKDDELRTVPIIGGTEKSLGSNVTHLTQTTSTTFAYQIAGAWHSYDTNANQVLSAQTPTSLGRAFLAARSGDGQNYLVADTIDGTPTLMTKSVGNGAEVKLFAGSSIAAPIRWIGNVAVYRVGSADFAVSPRGGDPKKITDITPNITPHAYPSFN